VTDALTARRVGQSSTGHAAPPGWRFGADPCPSHLVLEPGTASEEDLIRACGTGLLIQRVDYVRVVHARETLVTGTTRDATYWIEGGRVVARLPWFRFTLRLVDLFGAVEALGNQLERGEMVFMESIAAPAALVSAFPVGSVV
jgi:predicted Zn-dependent protease